MIAKLSIHSKLEKLKEYSGYLAEYQKSSLEDLQSNHTLQGAVLHYLQLSIEVSLDIGEMIVSQEKLNKPQFARDVFGLLAEKGIIDKAFAQRFAPVASLRNILVHEYAEIDLAQVYRHLQADLKDFHLYAQHIAKYLAKQ